MRFGAAAAIFLVVVRRVGLRPTSQWESAATLETFNRARGHSFGYISGRGGKKRRHGAVQGSCQRGGQSHAADEEAREGEGTTRAAEAEDRRGSSASESRSIASRSALSRFYLNSRA